jgi:predicted small secreted protein
MKKITLLLLVCAMLLTACAGGDVSEVGRQICPSDRYSEREIAAAMDVVESYFKKNFDGCTLHTLVYDEEATAREASEWAAQYSAEEAVVLLSDFYVDGSGGDGSLNPDSTYRNWKWILTRSGVDWELQTWGYG